MIETKNITLVRYEKGLDASLLHQLFSNKSNKEFFRRCPQDWNFQDVANFEESTKSILFSCMYGNEPMGFASFGEVDHFGYNCHIGEVLTDDWKDRRIEDKKVSFIIAFKLCKHIFKTTIMNKIKMRVLASREDLRISLPKGGFVEEAYLKENLFFDGKFVDEVEFALTRNDFKEFYQCLL